MYKTYILYYNLNEFTIGGIDMNARTINASDVRKDWGRFIDNTVRLKPQFIKRSRDSIVALNIDMFKDVLSAYLLTAKLFIEKDGSTTASLDQIDLMVNGLDANDALNRLAVDLIEYAEDFYENYEYWSHAPNRKAHIPYILSVLIQRNIEEVRGLIQYQLGKN